MWSLVFNLTKNKTKQKNKTKVNLWSSFWPVVCADFVPNYSNLWAIHVRLLYSPYYILKLIDLHKVVLVLILLACTKNRMCNLVTWVARGYNQWYYIHAAENLMLRWYIPDNHTSQRVISAVHYPNMMNIPHTCIAQYSSVPLILHIENPFTLCFGGIKL